MFWPDVLDLKQFYDSPLGHVAARLIRRAIGELCPKSGGQIVIGLGFATPYLLPFAEKGASLMAAMPAAQGAIYWPPAGGNIAVLTEDFSLPVADNMAERVILAHMLENAEHISALLEEVWRILRPGGTLIAIVPNRRGVWARAPVSPFAQGRPFTAMQLKQLLTENSLFTPLRASYALFAPPLSRRLMLRSAQAMESIGRVLCPGLGGVLIMEAEKQLYAVRREKARGWSRAASLAPAGARPAV